MLSAPAKKRIRRRLAAHAALWSLAGVLLPALAFAGHEPEAQQVPSTVTTTGCPEAFVWRVRVEVHRNTPGFGTELEVPVDAVQRAADFLGEATGCAAALHAEIVDDLTPYASSGYSDDLAGLRARDRTAGPWRDVDFTILVRRKLPGDPLGATDQQNIVVDLIQANEVLLTHELLHVFEGFYSATPWPDRDPGEDAIHELELWGYAYTYEGVAAFHRDLLAGRVDGNLGMPRSAWAVPETMRERKVRMLTGQQLTVARIGIVRRGGSLVVRGRAAPGAALGVSIDQRGRRHDRSLRTRARSDGSYRLRVRGVRTSGRVTVTDGRRRVGARYAVRAGRVLR